MKIAVIGAGPAGLYFSLLAKKHGQKWDPGEKVERGGVVLHDRLLLGMHMTGEAAKDIASFLPIYAHDIETAPCHEKDGIPRLSGDP